MKRREFIAGIAGSIAWPLAARAQPGERVRTIGVLHTLSSEEPDSKARLAAFAQGMQQLGWTDGRNLKIVYRTGTEGSVERIRRYAAELIALAPDAIMVGGAANVGPLLEATRTVPIVFVNVADPVGAGFVDSLARPGGNATGFIQFEYGLGGKWLELLKEVAPAMTRVAVVRDAGQSSGVGQFGAIQAVAPSLGLEVGPINLRDTGEIERTIAAFARSPNGGLIVTGSALSVVHRKLLIGLAAQHKLPAVYFQLRFVADGGLLAYGPDVHAQYRRAAGYIDRILKGEKPADLAVQAPTEYRLAINLKTAKALGLAVPTTLIARADEAIE
jgi:putative ABC transport system substrate-binding protein